MNDLLWNPPKDRDTELNIEKLRYELNKQYDIHLTSYGELYQWSIDYPELFWEYVCNSGAYLVSENKRF